MSPTSCSQTSSSLTRLLAQLKSISEVPYIILSMAVPKRQVVKTVEWSIFQPGTIMGEATRKIPTRKIPTRMGMIDLPV